MIDERLIDDWRRQYGRLFESYTITPAGDIVAHNTACTFSDGKYSYSTPECYTAYTYKTDIPAPRGGGVFASWIVCGIYRKCTGGAWRDDLGRAAADPVAVYGLNN